MSGHCFLTLVGKLSSNSLLQLREMFSDSKCNYLEKVCVSGRYCNIIQFQIKSTILKRILCIFHMMEDLCLHACLFHVPKHQRMIMYSQCHFKNRNKFNYQDITQQKWKRNKGVCGYLRYAYIDFIMIKTYSIIKPTKTK